jgi:hypothetical protein
MNHTMTPSKSTINLQRNAKRTVVALITPLLCFGLLTLTACYDEHFLIQAPVLTEENADYLPLVNYYGSDDLLVQFDNLGAILDRDSTKAWSISSMNGMPTAGVILGKRVDPGRYLFQITFSEVPGDFSQWLCAGFLAKQGLILLYLDDEQAKACLQTAAPLLRHIDDHIDARATDSTPVFTEFAVAMGRESIIEFVDWAFGGASEYINRPGPEPADTIGLPPIDNPALVEAWRTKGMRQEAKRLREDTLDIVRSVDLTQIRKGDRLVLDRNLGVLGFKDVIVQDIRSAASTVNVRLVDSGKEKWVPSDQLVTPEYAAMHSSMIPDWVRKEYFTQQ